MSRRTLQRRPREERVVVNNVLDMMRFRAAKAYLAQPDIAGMATELPSTDEVVDTIALNLAATICRYSFP